MSTPDDLAGLGDVLGDQLLDRTIERVQRTWDDLSDEDQDGIEDLTRLIGGLALRHALGEDVTCQVALARSTALDWCYVGASVIRGTLLEIAREAAAVLLPVLSKALVAVAVGALA